MARPKTPSKKAGGGGSRATTPGTGRKPAARSQPTPVQVREASDDESSGDDQFLSFQKGDSDDDAEDNEVFNLNVKDSDDEDEDEESSQDDSDNADDDDYLTAEDEERSTSDLQRLVDQLPFEMRNKIRGKQPVQASDDEDEEEEDEDGEKWGKKKSYWNADTADLEIGQEFADAEDEEEAARELHKQKLKRMSRKDYADDLDDEEEEDKDSDEDSETAWNKKQQQKKQKQKTNDRVAQTLEALTASTAANAMNLDDLEMESLPKDVSKFSKQQKLDLLAEHSPELLMIVKELRERIDELQSRVLPVQQVVQRAIEEKADVHDDLVDYLDVKQQLLLSYCTNVVFYLYLKARGQSIRSHPIMRQLLRLRYSIEKMQSIDAKVKHQIDRLVKVAESKSEDVRAGLMRPNLMAFLGNEDDEDEAVQTKKSSKRGNHSDDEDDDMDVEDEEEDEEEDRPSKKSAEIYKPKKMTAVHYPNEKESDKRSKAVDKQREKLKHSELLAALKDEFGVTPEESASSGLGVITGDEQRLDAEEQEKLRFEEERFMRHTVTKKEKKAQKKRAEAATRLDNFDDIGDFAELEKLSSSLNSNGDEDRMGASSMQLQGNNAQSLARAMQALVSRSGDGSSKKSRMEAMAEEFGGDDDDDGSSAHRKRRRAPMDDDGEEEDGTNIFDDFVSKKKEYLAKKKEHYTAEPRFGGYEETVDDGKKRAASYEIIKNRGLTPHRKKENRNARVKKRVKYAKAVVARKGQVRDVVTGMANAYGGEGTGIKSQLSRSRKL